MDLAGQIDVGPNNLLVSFAGDTVIRDYRNKDSDNDGKKVVWSPKSNILSYCPVDDLDGDGMADLMLTDNPELLGGALPGGNVLSREVVLLQKGKEVDRVMCDESGQFEFPEMGKGAFTLITTGSTFLSCVLPITVKEGN